MAHFPALIRSSAALSKSLDFLCFTTLSVRFGKETVKKLQQAGERKVVCHFRGQISHIALN